MYRLRKTHPLFAHHRLDAILIKNLHNIRYLTGFTGSTALVIATPKKALFLTDFRYKGYVTEALPPHFTFVDTATLRKDGFQKLLKKHGIQRLGFEANEVSFSQYTTWKKNLGATLVPVSNLDATLRIAKTDEEIDKMIFAQRAAEKTLARIMKNIKPGMTEQYLADEIEKDAFTYGDAKNSRKHGTENETRISFKPIVAFGPHSAIPHHQNTNRPFKKGDIVLIDMGFMHAGYCSDMTRTFFTKPPTAFEKKIYDLVLTAQETAIKHMKIGNTGGACDTIARDIIAKAGYKNAFGHSLGHGIGLEVHESPNLGPGSTDIFVENCVVTSEPGIYLPGKFGVRIEDMIYVTKSGPVNLTRAEK